MKKRKHTKAELSPIAVYAVAIGVSLASALILLAAASAIIVKTPDPNKLSSVIAYAVLYLSTFIGAVVTAKRSEAPIIASAIHGGILLVVYAVVSVFFPSDGSIGIVPSLVLHLFIPVSAVLAGFIVMKRSERRPKHRH